MLTFHENLKSEEEDCWAPHAAIQPRKMCLVLGIAKT